METISMSFRERKRLEVFSRVAAGEMSLVEASERLKVSYRHTRRLWKRYQEQGDVGLVHRARGRPSNRRPSAEKRERALELYREEYSDYGPTLAAECLAKDHDLIVARTTLQGWLTAAGLWRRQRKRKKHRRRRARREHAGELLQLDGSHHDWFEGRRSSSQEAVPYAGWAVLMVAVDDASGCVFARFYENESWNSAADVFQQYAYKHGLPRALYVDQASIYRADREPTPEELLANKRPETQFGRAMRELDVELILARSPQAKGRVERMNGTLQDRLVKAMRRAEINDLEAANRFLDETFLPELNTKFTIAAKKKADWHREVDANDLSQVLSIQETRVVQNDWTVRWKNRILQLAASSVDVVQPKGEVTVCELLDGSLCIFAGDKDLSQGKELEWTLERTPPTRPNKNAKRGELGPTGSSQGQKPAPNHPWRTMPI